jgi:hypothetical protein
MKYQRIDGQTVDSGAASLMMQQFIAKTADL